MPVMVDLLLFQISYEQYIIIIINHIFICYNSIFIDYDR